MRITRRELVTRSSALGIFFLVLVGAVCRLGQLSVDRGYEKILPSGDQSAADYRFVRRTFRNDEAAVVVAEGGGLWSPDALDELQRLSQALKTIEDVDRVTGITTARYIEGSKDQVTVKAFLTTGQDYDTDLRRKAVSYPPYRGWIVSNSGSALVHYVVARNGADPTLISEQVEEKIRQFRQAFSSKDVNVFQSGSLHASAELSRATRRSSRLLMATIGIMFGVSWVLAGSAKVAGIAASTGAFSVVFTFALMTCLGVPVNPVNALVPNILLPLGAAFTIHAHGYVLRGGPSVLGWIPKVAIRPFIFSTLSTMIGFGATALSSIPAVRQFGLFGAFGILCCAFVTFCFAFPLLTPTGAPSPKTASGCVPEVLSPKLVITAAAGVALLSAVGIVKIRIDYAPIDYFPANADVRKQFDRTAEILGAYSFFLTIRGKEEGDAIEPERLHALSALAKNLELRFPGVRVSSINDPLLVMHAAFTAGGPNAAKFPGSKKLVAQYLLLYTGDTDTYLSAGRKHLNAVVVTPFRSAAAFRRLEAAVAMFAARNDLDLILTGRIAQFFRAAYAVARDQVYSVCIGSGLVFLLFAVFFGSLRLALIAMIPNLLPVAVCFASLGWFGINLDIGTSIAGAIALGIVVDDTAHFLMNYTMRRRSNPADVAVPATLADLRRPITTTSICVIAGFLALVGAELAPFRTLGLLLVGIMLTGLFGDVVLLPSLLMRYDRCKER